MQTITNWSSLWIQLMTFNDSIPFVSSFSIGQENFTTTDKHEFAFLDELRGNATDRAIDKYSHDAGWPKLDGPTLHIIGVRIRVVSAFIMQQIEYEEISDPGFPYLDIHPLHLIKWFLTDWWRERGREFFAQDMAVNPFFLRQASSPDLEKLDSLKSRTL